MGVRDEALRRLREGLSPAEIARERGVTLVTIMGYLDQMVGAGRLRRSDILFSVPREIRRAIEAVLVHGRSRNLAAVLSRLERRGVVVDPADVEVVLKYGIGPYAMSDMYEDLQAIEVGLHALLRRSLEAEFGPEEVGWWRRGIPAGIRSKCHERREKDQEPPADPYCYTELIDLKEILDKRWNVLRKHLPGKTASDKQGLMQDLVRLNRIRNAIMHPIRGNPPTEDDFDFVRSLRARLGLA